MNLRILLLVAAAVLCPRPALANPSDSPLSQYLYRLLVSATSPGQSEYSMEQVPACGTDPTEAKCRLEPVCGATQSPLCAPPRWSQARGGWVRVESREAAVRRLQTASEALVRTATYLTRCKDAWGRVVEECEPVAWPEGPRSLGCALYASSVWESGYREDIMTGAPPAGRGTAGEACVMQVMPRYARLYTSWLTSEQQQELTDEQIAQELLGLDLEHLGHCYEVGARMLARFRSAARTQCQGSWVYAMYAMYGTGGKCVPFADARNQARKETQEAVAKGQLNPVMLQGYAKGDWAGDRTKTYESCMRRWPDGAPELPEWAIR